MEFKAQYATVCENCGINWRKEFSKLFPNNEDLNYCPICGKLLAMPNGEKE